jgi:hypothetical protein
MNASCAQAIHAWRYGQPLLSSLQFETPAYIEFTDRIKRISSGLRVPIVALGSQAVTDLYDGVKVGRKVVVLR